MIRFHARCELCMQDIFDAKKVMAYGIRDRKLYPVELGNTSGPWCGVRCVCLDCISFISDLATHNGPGKPKDVPGWTSFLQYDGQDP
jgi:hypothetical protein